jgi:hypothetical protein
MKSRMRGFSHDTKSELLIHSHLQGASNNRFHMILKEATGLSVDLEFSLTLQIEYLKLLLATLFSRNSSVHCEDTFPLRRK